MYFYIVKKNMALQWRVSLGGFNVVGCHWAACYWLGGHGRYITVTPDWALVSVGEWPLHIAAINL
jgi:hypothetical protein